MAATYGARFAAKNPKKQKQRRRNAKTEANDVDLGDSDLSDGRASDADEYNSADDSGSDLKPFVCDDNDEDLEETIDSDDEYERGCSSSDDGEISDELEDSDSDSATELQIGSSDDDDDDEEVCKSVARSNAIGHANQIARRIRPTAFDLHVPGGTSLLNLIRCMVWAELPEPFNDETAPTPTEYRITAFSESLGEIPLSHPSNHDTVYAYRYWLELRKRVDEKQLHEWANRGEMHDFITTLEQPSLADFFRITKAKDLKPCFVSGELTRLRITLFDAAEPQADGRPTSLQTLPFAATSLNIHIRRTLSLLHLWFLPSMIAEWVDTFIRPYWNPPSKGKTKRDLEASFFTTFGEELIEFIDSMATEKLLPYLRYFEISESATANIIF